MREMKACEFSSFDAIPVHWKLQKLKTVLTLRSEKNSGDRELLSVYLDRGVISYSDSTGMQVHKPSQDLSNYQNVHIGDFVLNNQQAWRGSVGVSKYEGIISPAYFVYRLSQNCYPGYMNYLFRDSSMVQQYEISSRGIGTIQRNIFAPWLLNCWILIPPFEEQHRIADFLDAKCAEIDALTADIQSQIDTLEQYKRSVITEAVTKGLNPDAEMKDSGVAWIGMVPEGWRISKIKYETVLRNEKGYFNSVSDSYIGLENVIAYSNALVETDAEYADSFQNICLSGDVLFNKLRPYLCKVIIPEQDSFCTGEFLIFKLFFGDKRFLRYFMLHHGFMSMVNASTYGTKMPRADSNFILNMYMLVPPVNEQVTIANYLDSKCAEIDSAIAEKQQQLETLNKYKQSLIFDYVTGKKEVPAVTASKDNSAIELHIILAGMVISSLSKKQLGKIQLEKALYFFHYCLCLGLSVQYYRFPHGPYDLDLDAYLGALQDRRWFKKISDSPEKYAEGENYVDFCKKRDSNSALSSARGELDKVIAFIKTMGKTSQIERAATLFAVWNDFLLDGITPSDDQIIREVMENWTENKANTQYSTWQGSLDKLKNSGIIPKGVGLRTLQKTDKRGSYD